jgi:hypothetical protein
MNARLRGDGRELLLTRYTAVQMIDVHLPTTEPEPELSLLLNKLKLELPAQPPPNITAIPPTPPTSL